MGEELSKQVTEKTFLSCVHIYYTEVYMMPEMTYLKQMITKSIFYLKTEPFTDKFSKEVLELVGHFLS